MSFELALERIQAVSSAVFSDFVAPPQDLSCGPSHPNACLPSYPSPPLHCWLRSGKKLWAFYLKSKSHGRPSLQSKDVTYPRSY